MVSLLINAAPIRGGVSGHVCTATASDIRAQHTGWKKRDAAVLRHVGAA
jgi:hypothetical protein